MISNWRKTSQELAPAHYTPVPGGQYDLYPALLLDENQIALGFRSLAILMSTRKAIIMDGQPTVLWQHLRQSLEDELRHLNLSITWHDISQALKPEHEINSLVEPFLGGEDPVFGTRFTGTLNDFFDPEKLQQVQKQPTELNIVYGTGASLVGWDDAFLVYVDVPKNEIQFRSRAGSVNCLGASAPQDPKVMYKRFYFVDWVVVRQHSANLLPRIDCFVDEQRPTQPTIMSGDSLRTALTRMSQNYFRARPWFEPGAWGGQWIKKHVPQLPQNAPNYAWSFELISPENGLTFRSSDLMLEASFDFLMFHAHDAVLGDCAERFGYEFPIRFDWLDTFQGGNLSVQCHPRPQYAKQHFGELFTQDETYYILDCESDAHVYLGFQEDIQPQSFREALETSVARGTPIEIERFVNRIPAQRGDLFLIPSGTVHCSGTNSLVLEISATPYIFTFKMYDWMRLDLDGKPRPLNIARAFENLDFDRKGERVYAEFISKPALISEGDGWRVIHLPTHAEHFYDIHRLEFNTQIEQHTAGSCHILSLVEGQSVLLVTANGEEQRFSFAETFVIPSAAHSYQLISESGEMLKVVKGFMKP